MCSPKALAVLALVGGLLVRPATGVPPDSPNSGKMGNPARSAVRQENPAQRQAAAAELKVRPEITVHLVRAEITVNAAGWPKEVKLLNPTSDEWSNRNLKRSLLKRRFRPAAGSSEPTAGTFIVTTRVEVRG